MRRQNMWIRRVPESVGDQDLLPYLLSLFNTMAPHVPDIDWRLDKAQRSLAPKPPAGENPGDINVHFHYFDSNKAFTVVTRNKTRLDFKDAKTQIFNDLSPITHAKRRSLQSMTVHLQNYKFIYHWGFPFRLSAPRDGIQHSMRDLQESETFLRNLDLPPLPEEDLLPLLATPKLPFASNKIWTPVWQKQNKPISTPLRLPFFRYPI